MSRFFYIRDFIGVLRVHDNEGHLLRMKERYASSLLYTVSGTVRFFDGNETWISDPQHPLFLPEGASYLNTCTEAADSIMFTFHAHTEESPRICPLPLPDIRFYERQAETMERLASAGDRFAVMSEFYAMLHVLFEAKPEQPAGGKRDYVADAKREMSRRLGEPSLTIGGTAETLHVSPVYLRKLFLRDTGESPHRYLYRLRMEKAAVLLMEGRPVGETAQAVGYAEVSQFSRAFSAYFGCSPRNYSGSGERK